MSSSSSSKPSASPDDDDEHVAPLLTWNAHLKSTVALCVCIASMSYTIISVFPYSGFMAIYLVDGVTEETAGSYAGLIASMFMTGRAISAYSWGKFADAYGRKFVLTISLLLSCIFSLTFGVSPTFGLALLSRFLLGLSNGIMSTAKTSVSELAYGNSKLEKRGMGLVVGCWGWGFLWSPAVGGFLAEPVKQYPHSALVQANSSWLGAFPFLLPNVVGIVLNVLGILAVEAWVPETLPPDKLRNYKKIPHDFAEWTTKTFQNTRQSCCHRAPSSTDEETIPLNQLKRPASLLPDYNSDEESEEWSDYTPENMHDLRLRRAESGNMLSTQVHSIRPRPSLIHVRDNVAKRFSVISHEGQQRRRSSIFGPTIQSLWARVDTRVHLLLYWLFSFVLVCGDEAFPLYCISREGGLGLSASAIGNILSGSGLIFAICQYFVYASIVNRLGVYESLIIGSLGLPLLLFIPFAKLFDNNGDNTMSWGTFAYLCSILAVSRIIGSVYFSSIFIALNRTVPATHRATMNGLQTLGGSISKGLGPTFAGLLVAFSVSNGLWSPKVGGFVVWFVIGILGILNTLAVALCLREDPVDEDGHAMHADVEAEATGTKKV